MTKRQAETLQPGYILHRSLYSNTSVLLECFTPLQGRFPVLAKGVLSKTGAQGGSSLQQFIPLLLSWSGRGEVKSLRSHDTRSKPYDLKGNRLFCGFYVNELLMRLLHREDAYESLFGFYEKTLERLSTERCVETVLRQFELQLLNEIGYGINLVTLDDDSRVSADILYGFEIERGPVEDLRASPVKVKGSTLIALGQGLPLGEVELKESKLLLRHILSFYLGDKPLKSRELFSRF